MFFSKNEELINLKKKYAKDRVIIFLGGEKKAIKSKRKIIEKCLKFLSEKLNYDLYIFDTDDNKRLYKYGTVFHYDNFSIDLAVASINNLYENGVYKAFVINAEIINKKLYNEFLNYRFLYFAPIKEIYTPFSHPNMMQVADADIFNIVRDIESLPLEKVVCSSKEGIKEFKEHQFNEPEKLCYLELDKKDKNNYLKIVDALIE